MPQRARAPRDLPDRLNMARQALAGDPDQVAIIDLTGAARRGHCGHE